MTGRMLMDIDDTNKDILRLLKDNGRMSFTEIGEKLGISRVAVKKRITKLEEAGIIRGYKAVIYHEENVKMLMEITLVDDDYEDLLEYLNRAICDDGKEPHSCHSSSS